VPIRYEIIALHVDSGYESSNKDLLKKFLEENNYLFHFKHLDIFKGKSRKDRTCFWCAWMRRKVFFEAAKEYNCNKIALGHHKDDIIQTILMNLLFEGQISAMAPYQELFKGKVAIIRPLAYLEEKHTEEFCKMFRFPISQCVCPNSNTSQRSVVRSFINDVELVAPGVKTNIFRSLQRVKKDYLL
jgi:tRNA 2-thiocytidine biosynthesis protein TtcA